MASSRKTSGSDPEATGACDIEHPALGRLTADEVRRSALLQLVNMGAGVLAWPHTISENNGQANTK
ncbi:MAG: hypothetical protein J0H74_18410 [Chitinophagaceae bacterium]|nr:hypothetical protein [Chitinophagaceae bacterium]